MLVQRDAEATPSGEMIEMQQIDFQDPARVDLVSEQSEAGTPLRAGERDWSSRAAARQIHRDRGYP